VITPERAEEIRQAIWKSHGWAKVGTCPTPEEDKEIQKYWLSLPGTSSYYTAVSLMAQGKHLTQEPA
jgi:hypothetical protein